MQSLTVPASVSKRKQACKSCRQRKKRCDGERPSCALSRKWNMRCEYAVPAALHAGGELSSVNYAGTLLGSMRQPVAPWDLDTVLSLPDFDFDAISGRQDGIASQMSYPTPISNPEPFFLSSGHDTEIAGFPDPAFPSATVTNELVDIFFDKLYFFLPCLHKKTFLDELHVGHIEAQSPLLLYSLLSIAAGFHPDPTIKARQKDWFEQAKLLYDFTGRAPDSALRTVQGVVFLVYHAYTCGDFSACWLYIGKAWRQAASLSMNRMDAKHAVVMPVGLKDGADDEQRGFYNLREWKATTVIEQEECRRVLWILFMIDRNQSWPTGWPKAIDEKQFKLDIPVADSIFQSMSTDIDGSAIENITFTRNVNVLISSASGAKDPLNLFHYLIIAYILLGRASDLVHSIHDDPSSPEYAQECEEIDTYVVKLRVSMPRTASYVLDAPIEDRGQVVWLNAIINTVSILLNYRNVPFSDPNSVKDLLNKTLMAAKNTSQTIKDASRASIDLLLNIHIASSLYVACCVLMIHHRLEDDASLKNDIDFLELVFERMQDVFTVVGIKFILALKRDKERNREELLSLRERGYRGLLADCSKWGFVQDEVMKMGLTLT
ncbi:hypothetical protein BU23DRAFT_55309 [Bimuria novae-zelandiae CBS 107.79]|uniref:Zn(2)-C6 fungal-type domain-containing protein n=1 Tax=Bimuria novae-zelandiae CBS 107.79 TaxID=1447943 RepID=A0A6A5UJL3_9PLEO|nr:hypothetical protein BU23DRAFT_55309 [Bimuria novae-zelandiae CBS 107.79]